MLGFSQEPEDFQLLRRKHGREHALLEQGQRVPGAEFRRGLGSGVTRNWKLAHNYPRSWLPLFLSGRAHTPNRFSRGCRQNTVINVPRSSVCERCFKCLRSTCRAKLSAARCIRVKAPLRPGHGIIVTAKSDCGCFRALNDT